MKKHWGLGRKKGMKDSIDLLRAQQEMVGKKRIVGGKLPKRWGQYRRRTSKNEMREKKLEREIINRLNLLPYIVAFKCGEGSMYNARYILDGMADVGYLDLRGNGLTFLEVKTPSGKQRDNQVTFEGICRQAGVEYFVVRSVREAEDTIQ